MKTEIKINWFKTSGKYYTSTTIKIPDNLDSYDARVALRKSIIQEPYHRELIAVAEEFDMLSYPFMVIPRAQ